MMFSTKTLTLLIVIVALGKCEEHVSNTAAKDILEYLNSNSERIYHYKDVVLYIVLDKNEDFSDVKTEIEVECLDTNEPCFTKVLTCEGKLQFNRESKHFDVISPFSCSPKDVAVLQSEDEIAATEQDMASTIQDGGDVQETIVQTETIPENERPIDEGNAVPRFEPPAVSTEAGRIYCTGCPVDLNTDVDGISVLANAALRHIESERDNIHALVQVVRVQRQIVAGVKYILTLKIAPTFCSKDTPQVTIATCAIIPDSAEEYCKVEYIQQPWISKAKRIISNNCTTSQEFIYEKDPKTNELDNDIDVNGPYKTSEKHDEMTPSRLADVEAQLIDARRNDPVYGGDLVKQDPQTSTVSVDTDTQPSRLSDNDKSFLDSFFGNTELLLAASANPPEPAQNNEHLKVQQAQNENLESQQIKKDSSVESPESNSSELSKNKQVSEESNENSKQQEQSLVEKRERLKRALKLDSSEEDSNTSEKVTANPEAPQNLRKVSSEESDQTSEEIGKNLKEQDNIKRNKRQVRKKQQNNSISSESLEDSKSSEEVTKKPGEINVTSEESNETSEELRHVEGEVKPKSNKLVRRQAEKKLGSSSESAESVGSLGTTSEEEDQNIKNSPKERLKRGTKDSRAQSSLEVNNDTQDVSLETLIKNQEDSSGSLSTDEEDSVTRHKRNADDSSSSSSSSSSDDDDDDDNNNEIANYYHHRYSNKIHHNNGDDDDDSSSSSSSSDDNDHNNKRFKRKAGNNDSSSSSSSSSDDDDNNNKGNKEKSNKKNEKNNNNNNNDSSSSSSSSDDDNNNNGSNSEERSLIRNIAEFAVESMDDVDEDDKRRVVLDVDQIDKTELEGTIYSLKIKVGVSNCKEDEQTAEKNFLKQPSKTHDDCLDQIKDGSVRYCKVQVHISPRYSAPKILKSDCGKQKRETLRGGIRNVASDDPKIVDLAHSTVTLLDGTTEHTHKYKVIEIESASKQIVSGVKYKFTVTISLSDCLKTDPKEAKDCYTPRESEFEKCQVEIWDQPWLPSGRKTTIKCENREPQKFRTRRSTLVGGVTSIPTTDPTVKELTEHTLTQLDKESTLENKYKITEIVSASRQVVAGLLYNIQAKIVPSDCLKTDSISREDCRPAKEQSPKLCNIKIWDKPWLPDGRQTNVTCDDVTYSYRSKRSINLGETDMDVQLDIFREFKQRFNKVYRNRQEEIYRFRIFSKNLNKIERFNSKEQGTAVYGITNFSDLSYREFRRRHMGYRPDLKQENEISFIQAEIPQIELPKEFDWRKQGVVTEVKDQGSCGSCWAFSVTGNVEGQYAIKYKKLLSLSEQELVDCDKYDEGCGGGLMDNAYRTIEQLGGLELESDYPYDAENEKCHFQRPLARVQLSGALNISQNETDMAKWLTANGPISIAINANAMQFYVGGVSHPFKFLCSPHSLDHGVLIVGYGVESYPLFKKTLPYWIVKNSWGKSWGEQGYYRVYRGDGTCGLNQTPSSSIVA